MKPKQFLTIKDGEIAWDVIQQRGLAPAWFKPPIALKCECGEPAKYVAVVKNKPGCEATCEFCIAEEWLAEFATEIEIEWEDKW